MAKLHLDDDVPHHDFRRIKNGRRRVAVLWPETVAALREYLDHHRKPKATGERIEFLTIKGTQHATTIVDNVSQTFNRLFVKAGHERPARFGFGSLRHMLGTMLDLVPDEQMKALMMGHTPRTIQQRIYSQFNIGELDRLSVVADILHQYLFEGKIG